MLGIVCTPTSVKIIDVGPTFGSGSLFISNSHFYGEYFIYLNVCMCWLLGIADQID